MPWSFLGVGEVLRCPRYPDGEGIHHTHEHSLVSDLGEARGVLVILTHAFHHGTGSLTARRELELAPRKMIRKSVAIF